MKLDWNYPSGKICRKEPASREKVYRASLRIMNNKDLTTEEWKAEKKRKKAQFTARQRLPYEVKIRRQRRRAWEFYEEMISRDANLTNSKSYSNSMRSTRKKF